MSANCPPHPCPLRSLAGFLLPVLLLAGCDSSPTAGDPDEAFHTYIAAAVAAESHRLTTSEDIERRVLEHLDGEPSGEAASAARGILLDAGLLAAESSDALSVGFDLRADQFHDWATESWMEAASILFDPGLLSEVIDGVEAVLDVIQQESDAGGGSATVGQTLRQVRFALVSARELSDDGQAGRALLMATRASGLLLELSPSSRLERVLERARALLDRATQMAGDDPPDPIAAALALAGEACDEADEAIAGDVLDEARLHAQRCHRLARALVLRLGAGVTGVEIEETARVAVARAAALLERAIVRAGAEPDEEIAAALDQAALYLDQAVEALELERWRAAIGLARSSSAVSTRIMLRLDSGADPDALAARAAKAIKAAGDLAHEAREVVGPSPQPLIAEVLSQADALIAQAEFAFAAGQWRRALLQAVRASDLLRRVILHAG
jgi:hypothetical protein